MIIPRTTVDYIRHARRLRWEYRDRPGQMHRRLRELSQGHDRAELSDTERATPEQAFTQLAREYMSGGVLRHDDRQRLMAVARRQSIKPFEANLLIALAQHHRQTERAAHEVSGTQNRLLRARLLSSGQTPAWLLTIVGVIIQAGIVGTGIWLFH